MGGIEEEGDAESGVYWLQRGMGVLWLSGGGGDGGRRWRRVWLWLRRVCILETGSLGELINCYSEASKVCDKCWVGLLYIATTNGRCMQFLRCVIFMCGSNLKETGS